MLARKQQIEAAAGDDHHEPTEAELELERRYEALLSLVLRTGAWLTSGEHELRGPAWEGAFAEYRENLRALKSVGDQIRPTTLRSEEETLAGRDLSGELAERFAA